MPILTKKFNILTSKDLIDISCDQCNTLFSKTKHRTQDSIANSKSGKLFCSSKCASMHRRQRIKTKCFTCQKDLELVLSSKTNRNFCSKSCAAKTNNKTKKHFTRPESPYSTVKPCKTCGTISKNFYCSNNCNPRRLKLTDAEKKQRIRSRQREAWQRYMAKRKNQTPPDADIKAMQLFYLNCPEGYEVDHIIPISKDGLHSLENLQYLTKDENRRKSNKLNWRE